MNGIARDVVDKAGRAAYYLTLKTANMVSGYVNGSGTFIFPSETFSLNEDHLKHIHDAVATYSPTVHTQGPIFSSGQLLTNVLRHIAPSSANNSFNISNSSEVKIRSLPWLIINEYRKYLGDGNRCSTSGKLAYAAFVNQVISILGRKLSSDFSFNVDAFINDLGTNIVFSEKTIIASGADGVKNNAFTRVLNMDRFIKIANSLAGFDQKIYDPIIPPSAGLGGHVHLSEYLPSLYPQSLNNSFQEKRIISTLLDATIAFAQVADNDFSKASRPSAQLEPALRSVHIMLRILVVNGATITDDDVTKLNNIATLSNSYGFSAYDFKASSLRAAAPHSANNNNKPVAQDEKDTKPIVPANNNNDDAGVAADHDKKDTKPIVPANNNNNNDAGVDQDDEHSQSLDDDSIEDVSDNVVHDKSIDSTLPALLAPNVGLAGAAASSSSTTAVGLAVLASSPSEATVDGANSAAQQAIKANSKKKTKKGNSKE
ncbi:MAG: hypothetical protein ACHP6I_02535 [Rickettsiales bacterium]